VVITPVCNSFEISAALLPAAYISWISIMVIALSNCRLIRSSMTF
jgi:hypothetical protein